MNLDGVNCLELYNELNLQYITQVFSSIQLSIQNDLKQVLFFFFSEVYRVTRDFIHGVLVESDCG